MKSLSDRSDPQTKRERRPADGKSAAHAPTGRDDPKMRTERQPPAQSPRGTESPSAMTGRRGEELAAEWLRREGYEICARNWRSGHYELDIVARRRQCLHFVEVKTRRAGGLTPPEQALTPAKCRALVHAAACYMARHAPDEELRFDLIAGDLGPHGDAVVRFIPDAVESHW